MTWGSWKSHNNKLGKGFYEELIASTIPNELIRRIRDYLPIKYFSLSNVSVSFHKIGDNPKSNENSLNGPEKIVNIFVQGDIVGNLTVGNDNRINSPEKDS